MKSCIVVFTYPNEYPRMALFLSLLKDKVDDIYACIESKHKDYPLPSFMKPLIFDFNRGRGLDGSEGCIGIKLVYGKLAAMGYDIIFKVDSDTIVFKPEAFLGPIKNGSDFACIRRMSANNSITGLANGFCYCLSKNAVEFLNKVPKEDIDKALIDVKYAEDLFFSKLMVNQNEIYRVELNKEKTWLAARPYRKSDCIAGHFGYVDIPRTIEELNYINPNLLGKIYTEENKAYISKIKSYCDEHKTQCGLYKLMYDRDGKPLEKVLKTQIGIKDNDKVEVLTETAELGNLSTIEIKETNTACTCFNTTEAPTETEVLTEKIEVTEKTEKAEEQKTETCTVSEESKSKTVTVEELLK